MSEGLAKHTNSIEITFILKHNQSVELKGKGTMWKTSIKLFGQPADFVYKYKIKTTKSKAYIFTSSDEFVDQLERSICQSYVQRDIISIKKKHHDNEGMIKGIVAHIEDILQDPNCKVEAAFHELDNINSGNNANVTHWNGAFQKLLDGYFTEEMCLLLLYCMHKRYVDSAFYRHNASKIWANVKQFRQTSKDICVQFVEEIYQIYEASGQFHLPIHFINDMQYILDISSIHKVLNKRSWYPVHDCKESLSCLRMAMQFVMNQDLGNKLLYDVVYLIFDYIPEKEILEGFVILNEFDATDKQKDLKQVAQKHVIEKIKTILTGYLSYLNFKAMNDILSKAEGDLRCSLVQHCETEILDNIRNKKGVSSAAHWKDLENLCFKQLLFQSRDQQVMLLDLSLHVYDKPRDFIKYVLMHFQTNESECAKETLEKAYDVLLDTLSTEHFFEAKLCFEEYDALSEKQVFQAIREHIENRLQSHISKYHIETLLMIHADIENLQSATIDLYCQQLQIKMKTQAFEAKLKILETYWDKLNSR